MDKNMYIFILLPVITNLFSVDYVHQSKRSTTMKDLLDFLGRKYQMIE